MSAASYLAWAEQALATPSRAPLDIQQAIDHPAVSAVIDATDLAEEPAAWLAATTLQLRYSHQEGLKRMLSGRETLPLAYRWATLAPRLEKQTHINEVRFARWLDAGDWQHFLRHTIEALRVLKGSSFRLEDLHDIAVERTADFDKWRRTTAQAFYPYQPKGLDGHAPPYVSPESEPEQLGVLTLRLPMRKKSAYVKAAQAEGKKLAPWVIEQLDAAANKGR
ncbi:MAG: hypothetical protein M0R28_05855 [Pigmentiphaga sp.]|nr:hypothetical protein [Pigmentiphaga sp.]